MEESISNNKRIAKNTLMLYIRMLLSIVVSLYTSRIVIDVLGVEDYGIYGVVGGVVTMFSFLNSSMAGATSRFLTFEMGQGNVERLKETFSSALIIHIILALLIFILAETVGLWFLCHKLVIPEGRVAAAHLVYQCSILSAVLSITQVPYNSLIIAHERMGVYAYIEILNVILKLLIVYILSLFNFDKLKLYSILVLAVSTIVIFVYRIYCIKNFSESSFKPIWNTEILKPMLSFSSWDFYGNMCVTARAQGTNFLINNFFGVVVNASSSIATTINGVVGGFASNIITAFRPRIIKYYSQKDWSGVQSMVNNAIRFSTLFLTMLALPIIYETSYVINLWLGQVPPYVVPFLRLTLVSNCIGIINSIIVISIHATGRIKCISFLTGTVYLLTIPVSYFCLKLGYDVVAVYFINLVSNVCILALNLCILKKQVTQISILSILREVFSFIIITLLTALSLFLVFANMQESFLRLIILGFVDIVAITVLTYIIALNKDQRNYVKRFIKSKLNLSHGNS